jgi:PIN domain nuclease of toxin-antitoxin system
MFDTHVVTFVYQKEFHKFKKAVKELIENEFIYISPIVVMELKFLNEIGRIKLDHKKVISELSQEIGLKVDKVQFNDVIESSLDLTWTRDPFDRLIVANAKYRNAKLVTKDQRILDNFDLAVW